jgi:hypothetical protein
MLCILNLEKREAIGLDFSEFLETFEVNLITFENQVGETYPP